MKWTYNVEVVSTDVMSLHYKLIGDYIRTNTKTTKKVNFLSLLCSNTNTNANNEKGTRMLTDVAISWEKYDKEGSWEDSKR
jgi:hypothetical protein